MSWRENPHWDGAYEHAKRWPLNRGIVDFVASKPRCDQADALGACIAAYWCQADDMVVFADAVCCAANRFSIDLLKALRASGHCHATQAIVSQMDKFEALDFGPSPLVVHGKGDWRLSHTS